QGGRGLGAKHSLGATPSGIDSSVEYRSHQPPSAHSTHLHHHLLVDKPPRRLRALAENAAGTLDTTATHGASLPWSPLALLKRSTVSSPNNGHVGTLTKRKLTRTTEYIQPNVCRRTTHPLGGAWLIGRPRAVTMQRDI
ncbi:unnamed protein product, partial [Rhizoctonia solani]